MRRTVAGYIIAILTCIAPTIGLTQPQIVVTPQGFDFDLIAIPDEFIISVENEGDSLLIFQVVIQYFGEQQEWIEIDPVAGRVEPNRDTDLFASLVWDNIQRNGEYSADIHISSNDPERPDVRVNVYFWISPPQVIISLSEGWNLYSSHLDLSNRDIPYIFRHLVEGDILQLVKDDEGRFYAPEFDFNSIPFWDFRQGYLVKMSEADELWILGDWVAVDTPIPLTEGWNMVAYFPEDEIEAPEAFANIADVLVAAKDGEGNFYRPGMDFNNMEPLRRTRGYQVNVSEDVELVWNFEE